ncbi:MAG TPA: FAD-linked oxidase C-terminal domain-containing protein [Candidatus Binataceae bacterium]|nr:FAD-linked oxidase C-terminal domain-containing protein [Candidatus Binataceae bacterium]
MAQFGNGWRPAPRPTRTAGDIDVKGLANYLSQRVQGEVRFDAGARALYSTAAANYRQVPIGVVVPRDAADVELAMEGCRRFNAPIVFRGGGTGLAGQTVNVAVLIDTSKYMREILSLDPVNKRARVQPGVVLDQLRTEAGKHQLTFGPDPSTHTHNTLGGMIGNNSCGVHSVMAGRTVENVYEMEILTYDGLRMRVGPTAEAEVESIIREGGRRGEIFSKLRDLRNKYAELIRQKFPNIPRRVSGYNLDELLPEKGFNLARALVGTEGTCVAVLEASVRLIDSPRMTSLLVLGFPDIFTAGDYAAECVSYGANACEGIDEQLLQYNRIKHEHLKNMELLPPGGGWLMIEFGGKDKEESDAKARRLMAYMARKPNPPSMKLFDDPQQEITIWKVRESGLGATAWIPGHPASWPGWEDSAVPPEKVGNYLRDFRKLLDRYQYECALYGHIGQGCVHCRISFDLVTEDGVQKYRSFISDAADLVVSYGGSLSGEHGDGQSRAEFLPKMFGPELVDAFRQFKQIWDPSNKMNPHKVVDPYPIDHELRLGTDYRPPEPATHFGYPEDNFSFSRATMRCVGVGNCRQPSGGTMCPSFMVTHEEMHSTRGRARMLFEMLQGNPLSRGWRDPHVHDALHLCLSCKGCKGECPVAVDMATYKAEFMSHYYKGRLRPHAAYSMGLIFWWAQLASYAPGVANFMTQTPILRSLTKLAGGIAQQRELPQFAQETFKDWFRSRPEVNRGLPQVILWPDTFNNYFHPETAKAAVEVLEQAGFQVLVPQPALCCGRPLYDFGMLDLARHKLRQILIALRPQISADVPIIGLEPSCVSVFRDEMKSLLPHDVDAQRMSRKVFTLSEFLMKEAEYEPPQFSGKALVHGHCHEKSILEFNSELELLKKMGMQAEAPESGCCGMAGSFGFEPGDKYEVSMKCGERVLLPKVREAEPRTLIVSDGFSCRTQIEQTTNRTALHFAQVLQMAIAEDRLVAEGRSRAAIAVPRHRRVTATSAITAGMISDNQPQDHHRTAGAIAVTAGSVAGGLLLAYIGSRYFALPGIARLNGLTRATRRSRWLSA